ncbi:MAG TPA: HEAT repeat domain-containing protein [Armatimonadota bacterium]|nr:HEAT repeat domain-containing protein [Armatimonadota bacterium]
MGAMAWAIAGCGRHSRPDLIIVRTPAILESAGRVPTTTGPEDAAADTAPGMPTGVGGAPGLPMPNLAWGGSPTPPAPGSGMADAPPRAPGRPMVTVTPEESSRPEVPDTQSMGVPELEALLEEDRVEVREAAEHELLARIDDAQAEVREAAARALGKAGKAVLPAMVQRATAGDVAAKCDAALELGRLGALASKAVPKLIELLDDPAKAVGKAALEALPAIGDQARPAQGTLVGMLKDPSPEVRAAAARGLAIAGESASRAIEALSGMKASGGLVYNIAIGRAKKEFAEGQKGKVAGLKPLVSDPDPKVRRAVQEALAKIKEG